MQGDGKEAQGAGCLGNGENAAAEWHASRSLAVTICSAERLQPVLMLASQPALKGVSSFLASRLAICGAREEVGWQGVRRRHSLQRRAAGSKQACEGRPAVEASALQGAKIILQQLPSTHSRKAA